MRTLFFEPYYLLTLEEIKNKVIYPQVKYMLKVEANMAWEGAAILKAFAGRLKIKTSIRKYIHLMLDGGSKTDFSYTLKIKVIHRRLSYT